MWLRLEEVWMATTPKKQNPAPATDGDRDGHGEVRWPKQDPCCVGPCDPPWRDDDQCLIRFEIRYLRVPLGKGRPADVATALREYIEFRIVYEHRLCRLGKQLGPLLYTVTLLPGEKVTLYHSDRYQQITSVQNRYSVETTFTQFLSVIHQARVTSQLDALGLKLADIKARSASALGGELSGVLGSPGNNAKPGTPDDHATLNLNIVSDQFSQSAVQASQMTHAERSVVISSSTQSDTENSSARTLSNDNQCRAVTYFVRKVMELYELSTIVAEISYRIIAPNIPPDWHDAGDLGWLPSELAAEVKAALKLLPQVGALVQRPKPISLPTDGVVYDPELAHCCSCEPQREAAMEIELRKKEAEVKLLEAELERRRLLLQKGELGPFECAEPPPEPAA
jgi:thermitase